MDLQPYDLCPCGTGKKVKWCAAKFLPEFQKAQRLVDNNQFEAAEAAFAKLKERPGLESCAKMFLGVHHANAVAAAGGPEKGLELIEQLATDYPDYGYPLELLGGACLEVDDIERAIEYFGDAYAHYPEESPFHRSRCLFQLGVCHLESAQPLAAWAHWKLALKIAPDNEQAKQGVEEAIKENPLLPNQVRHGLELLRHADEDSMPEDRKQLWKKAIYETLPTNLDELARAFEEITEADSEDKAGWYNLALALAWQGVNDEAIEAMDRYVQLEDNVDRAADAWDLAETLRFGVAYHSNSDHLVHRRTYLPVQDRAQELIQRLEKCGHVKVVVSRGPQGERRSMHWMDKPESPQPQEDSALLVGQTKPRQLAQLVLAPDGTISLHSYLQEDLEAATTQFESIASETVNFDDERTELGLPHLLDAEPLMAFDSQEDGKKLRAQVEQSVQEFYENVWTHRPLRSLDGLTPLDAAESDVRRKKLEGVIRCRERLAMVRGVQYEFDRLRQKLGMVKIPAGPDSDDVASFALPQLQELVPASLSDDDILKAFHASATLDAAETSLQFAENLITRDSLQSHAELPAVYSRVIRDRIDAGHYDDAHGWIDKALAHDQVGGDEHAHQFESLRARLLLREGKADEAFDTYQTLLSRRPDDVPLLAEATERLMSAGAYGKVVELAERGLEQSKSGEHRGYRDQFQEYLEEAKARA